MRASTAEALGLDPIARIAGHGAHAHEPGRFTTAPGPAMRKALARAGWSVGDVDLFEVNEAFAVVAMIAMRELGIEHEQLNVNGGACALVTRSARRARASWPPAVGAGGQEREARPRLAVIGGGEAVAMAVERV